MLTFIRETYRDAGISGLIMLLVVTLGLAWLAIVVGFLLLTTTHEILDRILP